MYSTTVSLETITPLFIVVVDQACWVQMLLCCPHLNKEVNEDNVFQHLQDSTSTANNIKVINCLNKLVPAQHIRLL